MENIYSDYDGLVPTPEQVEAEDRYWSDRDREEAERREELDAHEYAELCRMQDEPSR